MEVGELKTDSGSGPQNPLCTRCGQAASRGDVLRLGDEAICADCKPLYLQQLREGVPLNVAPAVRYGGFWIRGVALLIDTLIFFTGQTLFWMAMGENWKDAVGFEYEPVPVFEWSVQDWMAFAAVEVLGMIYSTVMVARYGGTLGKLALGLRVVTTERHPLSYAGAFRRNIAMYLSALPFVVPLPDAILLSLLPCLGGFAMAAFDSQKRALHDRICGTRVIRLRKEDAFKGQPPA
jgi:uncharacterized RDD family membrane protein YckC